MHSEGGFGLQQRRGLHAAAMQQAGIPFESWTAAETMRHFPQFRLKDDDRVVYEASAGLVDPSKANAAHRALGRGRVGGDAGKLPGESGAPSGRWGGGGDGAGRLLGEEAGGDERGVDQPGIGGGGRAAAADGDRGAGDVFHHAAFEAVQPRTLPDLDLAREEWLLRLPGVRGSGDQSRAGCGRGCGDGGDAQAAAQSTPAGEVDGLP